MKKPKSYNPKRKNANLEKCSPTGFSMVELLISITIFLIAVSAVYGIFRIASLQRNVVNNRTDSVKGARIALAHIRRDAINTGLSYHRIGGLVRDDFANSLLQMPADADSDYDLLTAIMAGNDVNSNLLNLSGKTDSVTFIYRDLDFNPEDASSTDPRKLQGRLIEYNNTVKGSNTRVDVKTNANGAFNAKKYDLYLFETGNTQIVGMVTGKPSANDTIQLATGDPLGLNQKYSATGSSQSLLAVNTGKGTIKKIFLINYYVNADGVLIRKNFGNFTGGIASEQIEVRELISGVKDMQVKYLLEDGTTSDDPSKGYDGRLNQQEMNKVVQIEITLTILPLNQDGIKAGDTPITVKETISTRNLRYDNG